MKILISLSKGLTLVKEHYRQAKGNKNAGTLIIDPMDFLILTTKTDKGIEEIMQEAQTLDAYNEYTKAGKSILMPWLEISTDGFNNYREPCKIGQVVAHEGRHRAAALIKAGVKRMPISLRLFVNGYAKYNKPTAENPWAEGKWSASDLPKTLYGEFNSSRTVKIDTGTFKAF